jgi:hypothetical protein
MWETRGTALLVCLFALLLLTLLGGLALSSAEIDLKSAIYQQQEVIALYLADSGIHLMVYWLEHPQSAPASVQSLLTPRFISDEGVPIFIDEEGSSQFSGTRETPDLQIEIGPDTASLDTSLASVWNALDLTSETLSLKLYAPIVPGAVGTLESAAKTTTLVQKTITVQLVQVGSRLVPMRGSWYERYE